MASKLTHFRHLRRFLSQSPRLASSSSSSAVSKRRELDRLGTWDSRIDFSLEKESSIRHGTLIPDVAAAKNVGRCSQEGRRSYQEDRFVVSEPAKGLLLLAVFDGHGGDACAEFCARQLETFIRRRLEKASVEDSEADLEGVLRHVVLDLEASFERHWKANKTRKKSPGSTATIALLRRGYELVVAQVGDSRAVLCRDGQAQQLTQDHCPSESEEKSRIESNGGSVSHDAVGRYMVNERLSMSRSIGDFELKSFGVIAEPTLSRLNLKHGKDSFLLLVSDGISFVMSNEEMSACVGSCERPQEAAERLVDQALLHATEDNVTALILPLGSWGKGDNAGTSMLFSIGRNMALTSRFS